MKRIKFKHRFKKALFEWQREFDKMIEEAVKDFTNYLEELRNAKK